MTYRRRQQRGFSLVEILVSLVILGTGLLVVSQFQGKVLKQSGASKDRQLAITYARETMESVITQITAGAALASYNVAKADLAASHYCKNLCDLAVTLTPQNGNLTKDILIEVTWSDIGATPPASQTYALRSSATPRNAATLAWTEQVPDTPATTNPDPDNIYPNDEEVTEIIEVTQIIEQTPGNDATACNCGTYTASLDNPFGNGYVKVGGMHRMAPPQTSYNTITTTSTSSITLNISEPGCNECCAQAALVPNPFPVAGILDRFMEKFASFGDYSYDHVWNDQFPLSSRASAVRTRLLKDTEWNLSDEFRFQKTGMGGSSGMGGMGGMGSPSPSPSPSPPTTTTYTMYAACTIEVIEITDTTTLTKTTTSRSRMMHGGWSR